MDVGLSTGALVSAAGATAVVGGMGLAVVLRMSRTSPTWAVRLAPITAVIAVAAGVTAASSLEDDSNEATKQGAALGPNAPPGN